MRSISNEINTFNNIDCIEYMKTLPNNSVDMTLTDIPYGEVSRETNGLTNLKSLDNLGAADRKTFDEIKFCEEVYRITKNSICIFCGREQFSTIFQFFKGKKGTVRPIVWEKCLAGNTEIAVLNTFQQMTTISLKDLIRTNYELYQVFNGEKWVPIKDIKETKSVDNYLKITLRNGNVICTTKEHRYLVNNKLLEAEKLKVGQILDYSTIQNKQENLKTPMGLTKNALWFIGLYLGDGSKSGETIQIAANRNDYKEKERLLQLSKEYNFSLREYIQSENAINYHIDSQILSAILKEYLSGNTAYGKHFSTKALNLEEKCLKEILEGYLYADGHWEEKTKRWRIGFTRKNIELQKDLRFICNLLQYDIKMQYTTTKAFNSSYPTIKGSIKYEKSTHYNAKSGYEIIKIELINNSKKEIKFYDLALEDEPHLFCLHDGVLTHNSNPVPSNGKYVYLSGVEFAVWFKKAGSKSFNAYCKNTVFRYPIPSGQKRIHKTQKHWDLWKEIMLDCSNENEIIFDPCAGSGVTAWVAKENNRNFICCELDKDTYNISKAFLQSRNIIT